MDHSVSSSNSWMGSAGAGSLRHGWNNITVLSERNAFVLYTAISRGRKYVLKALRAEHAANANYRSWLEKEYRIGMELDHPGVVRVDGMHSIPEVSPAEVMVMEWIDGVDLSEFLRGKPTPEARRRVALELAEALEYIHSTGACHRDLKPDNIMVTRRGGHVRIIDFGLGDVESDVEMKTAKGTRSYGAPEQQNDESEEIDSTTDVWSFGRLLEDLHCGSGYRRLGRRCMRSKREKRPSMTEVVRRLGALQHGAPGLKASLVAAAAIAIALAAGFFAGKAGKSDDAGTDAVTAAAPDTVVRVVREAVAEKPAAGSTAEPEVKVVELTENEAGVDELVDRAYREYQVMVQKYKDSYRKLSKQQDYEEMQRVTGGYTHDYAEIEKKLVDRLREMGLTERRVAEIQAGFAYRVMNNNPFANEQ